MQHRVACKGHLAPSRVQPVRGPFAERDMNTARRSGRRYFVRFALVAFALPALPAAGVFLSRALPRPGIVSLAAALIMLVVWGFLARRILGKFTSRCPQCGRPNAKIESVDEMAFLVCPDCGWKGETGYDFKDRGG